MRLIMSVDDTDVCVLEIFEDKVPTVAAELRRVLPHRSVMQHGKIIGEMVFWTMPVVAAWENDYLTEEVGRLRTEEVGHPGGAVCFYSPRQQFCVTYGDDLADEPLRISYIGQVVEGATELALAGTRNWIRQGQVAGLRLEEPAAS